MPFSMLEAIDQCERMTGRNLDWELCPRERTDAHVVPGSHAASPSVDVVLSRSEVNNRYGTGILIQRMFPQHRANVVSIRSASIWNGEQQFGIRQLVIPSDLRRSQIYAWTLTHTEDLTIGRVYCVPYRGEEIIAALALCDAHRAPFCLYVMDDQNVASNGISDELMSEAIDKARLRLAISSDMRDAYHAKYGRRFWIAPPTLLVDADPLPNHSSQSGRGILIGNISAQEWLDALIPAIGGSQLRLDWFSNSPGGGYWHRRESIEALMGVHIRLCDPLPEPALASQLPSYEVAVVPTMPPQGSHANFAVSSLSFPSRLTFLVVKSDLPVLVLGDEDSCVARFVRHFGLGFTCPYESAALDHALAATRDPAWRQTHRAAVKYMRRVLGGTDIASWVRDALDRGAPADLIFETLDVQPHRFPPLSVHENPSLEPWLHECDPAEVALRNLAATGYDPDFVVDVGAGLGVWSYVASRTFPRAQFALIDPDLPRLEASPVARYTGGFRTRLASYQVSTCVLSDIAGEAGGVRTLDSLWPDLGLSGRGLLRIGVSQAGLQVLRGSRDVLETAVDVVIARVPFETGTSAETSQHETEHFLGSLGFTVIDEIHHRREAQSGALRSRDLLFVKSTDRAV